MRIVGKSDKGYKRPDNQDRYLAGTLANGVCFGFVRDGMGGANGGSVASEYLCKTIEEHLFAGNNNTAMNPEETILGAIDDACKEIYIMAKKDEKLKGMGTTISGVTVKDDICTVYNVGDSRVYVFRRGVLTLITEDHSIVQQLYRQGAITEEEMAVHPQKNLITRAVGVHDEVDIDISEVVLQKGDRVLCTSDGLTNFVSLNELEILVGDNNFYDIPSKLIEKALGNNASDNITAVVMEY